MTYYCIITVRDEHQQRMPDVLVKLFHHFDLYDVTSGYTNHRGEVTLYVPEGVYRVFVEKEGYQQVNYSIKTIDKNNIRIHMQMKRIPKSVEVKVHIKEWIEGKHKDVMPYIFGAEVTITHKVNLTQQKKIAYTGIAVFDCEEGAEYTVSALMKDYEEFYTPNPFKASQGLDFTYYLRKKAEIPTPTPTPTPPPQKNVEIIINVNEFVDNRVGSFIFNAEIFLTDEETKITKKQLAPLGSTKFTCIENRKYTLSAKAEGYEPIVSSYSITAVRDLTHTYLMRKVITITPTPPPTIPPTPPTPPTHPPTPPPSIPPVPSKFKLEIIVRDLSKFPGMLIPSVIGGAFDMISRIANAKVEIYHQNILIASSNTNTLGLCSFSLDINKTYSIIVTKNWFEMVQPVSVLLNDNVKLNVWLKPTIITITDKLGNSLRASNDKEKNDINDFFGLPDKKDINTYLTELLSKAKAHRLLDNWKDYWIKMFNEHTLDRDNKLDFVKRKYSEFFNKLGTVNTTEILPCKIKFVLTNKENLIPVNVKFYIEAVYNQESIFKSKIYDVMLFMNIPYTDTLEVNLRQGIIPKNVIFTIYVYHIDIKDDKLITKITSAITY